MTSIARVAGKGYGVLATRLFRPGEQILHETPLVRVNRVPSPSILVSYVIRHVNQLRATRGVNLQDRSSWPLHMRQFMDHVVDVQAQIAYEEMPKAAQAQWMALHDIYASNRRHTTPGGVLRTNGFADREFADLYAQLSRVNHSCKPNAKRLHDGHGGGGVIVKAARDINKGDEVLISYFGDTDKGLSVEMRRKRLQADFSFFCMCSLCKREAP
jgi:hypothetical protein